MRSYYFKSTTDTSWTQQQTKKNFFSIEGSSNSKNFLKSLSSQIFFAGFKNSACSDSPHRHFLPPCHFSRLRFAAERDPLKNIWCEWMLVLMTVFGDKVMLYVVPHIRSRCKLLYVCLMDTYHWKFWTTKSTCMYLLQNTDTKRRICLSWVRVGLICTL